MVELPPAIYSLCSVQRDKATVTIEGLQGVGCIELTRSLCVEEMKLHRTEIKLAAIANRKDGPGTSLSHLQEKGLPIVRHHQLFTARGRHLGCEHLKHTR
jgi:hypothetical protein